MPCGRVEADVVAHAIIERRTVDEMRGLLDRLERVVGGEHHAVVAERADRAGQGLGGAHARRRHDDVVLDVLRRKLGEFHRVEARTCPAVETPQQERQGFAEMAERQPGARKAVEDAAENDA